MLKPSETFPCNKSGVPNIYERSTVDNNKNYSFKNVKSTTYLGVQIDQYLKWDGHKNLDPYYLALSN